LESLAPYLYDTPPLRPDAPPVPPIDWAHLFGNAHPVEIEVGFGKGLFLLTTATAHPEINYFGIEIERKYQLFTANRIARRNLTNVRLAATDAKVLMRTAVPEGSIQGLHVYFPDPWWKTRHHKRRLFTEEFARLCVRVLRPGGILHFASDVEDYFKMVLELVAQVPELRALPPPAETAPQHDLDYLTNFERKFRMQGKPIYRARFERGGNG